VIGQREGAGRTDFVGAAIGRLDDGIARIGDIDVVAASALDREGAGVELVVEGRGNIAAGDRLAGGAGREDADRARLIVGVVVNEAADGLVHEGNRDDLRAHRAGKAVVRNVHGGGFGDDPVAVIRERIVGDRTRGAFDDVGALVPAAHHVPREGQAGGGAFGTERARIQHIAGEDGVLDGGVGARDQYAVRQVGAVLRDRVVAAVDRDAVERDAVGADGHATREIGLAKTAAAAVAADIGALDGDRLVDVEMLGIGAGTGHDRVAGLGVIDRRLNAGIDPALRSTLRCSAGVDDVYFVAVRERVLGFKGSRIVAGVGADELQGRRAGERIAGHEHTGFGEADRHVARAREGVARH
jgi:hypothetical protein